MTELYRVYLNNWALILGCVSGLLITICGFIFNDYGRSKSLFEKYRAEQRKSDWGRHLYLLDRVTSVFPLKRLKSNIISGLSLNITDDFKLKLLSNLLCVILLISAAGLIIVLKGIGQLWYVKILVGIMCFMLPFYLMELVFEFQKLGMNKNIPVLIDEFRSAFIKHNKIKPALLECSGYVDNRLGAVIRDAADSRDMDGSLKKLGDKLDNVWFNIFATLLVNFKEGSGNLIDQLYDLNRTMTRYCNVEKKKNKRLIWYEVFAVGSSIFSIPAVFWLNAMILGKSTAGLIDANANMIISRIVGYSIISLIVIRLLRKM